MSSTSLQLWEYRDTAILLQPDAVVSEPVNIMFPPPVAPTFTQEEVAERIQDAVQQAAQQWAATNEQQAAHARGQLHATLQAFHAERSRYFRHAEAEVVSLALAVARKILQREAQLDSDLLAALVRIALEGIDAESAVKLRVNPGDLNYWQDKVAADESRPALDVIEDRSLPLGECIIETELGAARIGIEAQFKVIEQGMLDLLRLRPATDSNGDAGRVR